MTSRSQAPAFSDRRDTWAPFALMCAVVAVLMLAFSWIANAQAVADPVATAAASSDALLSIAMSFGPLWGGMAIAFGIASTVLKRNESAHWIAQGRTLAVITAAVGLGIAALMAHFGGAPWSGVLLTLVLGVFKLIDPTTTVPVAVRKTESGFARLWLLVALAIVACAAVKSESVALKDGVVTCAKSDVPAAKTLGLQLGTEALADFLAGKTQAEIWAHVSGDAEAAGKVQGLTIASCAFGGLVAELDRALHPAPPDGPSARSAVVEPQPLAGAHAALVAFESAHGITRIDP